jgi:hypothetical protein
MDQQSMNVNASNEDMPSICLACFGFVSSTAGVVGLMLALGALS